MEYWYTSLVGDSAGRAPIGCSSVPESGVNCGFTMNQIVLNFGTHFGSPVSKDVAGADLFHAELSGQLADFLLPIRLQSFFRVIL